MKEVWTVWTANDEMETLLVGIATNEKKAYKMRATLEEKFDNAYEILVCKTETDKLNINDANIQF